MENLNQNKSADIIAEEATENQEVFKNVSLSAVNKLTDEANSVSGQNVPAIAIFRYLVDKVKDDTEFSKCVMREEKTLSKCFTYLTQTALNKGIEQNPSRNPNTALTVGMSSAEIFGIVNEYYELTDEEIEKRKKQKLAEIEAEKVKAEKIRTEVAKKREKKKQETAAVKKSEREVKDSQISLFDMQGGDTE